MDLISFATLFSPRSLGIQEQASKALLTRGYGPMDMELYELNVYGKPRRLCVFHCPQHQPYSVGIIGKGDFSKAHKDMPRAENMFGSLVVVLPTAHEGGQIVLHQAEKEWTLDFAPKFATATEPTACFVTFYGDLEHEVLPVTSGYRVTLTYNLYHKPVHPEASSIPTPFHLKLRQALIDLVNDPTTLPNGGYLGFGLMHEYVYTRQNLLEPVMAQLKGSDRALVDVCDALGLRYSLRLLYREISCPEVNLLTTETLDAECLRTSRIMMEDPSPDDYFRWTLDGLTMNEVEGVAFVGQEYPPDKELVEGEILKSFYKVPATEVLEITPMQSSVDAESSFITYGNHSELEHFYGTACMVVELEPAQSPSRRLRGL